ncbi:DUF4307 domain-containing protein [Actinoalloteichus spitiensis]|uniref:DUF4307 domain-containing protein n=1 Tax=Actinoalloteichus spitiensis TaxID=252394 RepID=UPI000371234D|nr:DUF4307 domain-containing protein [Actinoalloteichus spitiensis]
MTSNEAPGRPAGRYRRAPARRFPRWAGVLTGVAVLLVGLGASVTAYQNWGSPPVSADHTSFEPDGRSLRISFDVVRDDPSRSAVCVLRARSADGDESGRREVLIPPGESPARHTSTLLTSKPPVMGEVFGCSHDVPEYLTRGSTVEPDSEVPPSG